MKLITPLTLLLLCTSVMAQLSFTVASSATSPNTARSPNSQYTIQLNAITLNSSNFDLSVSFTSAFSLSAVTGCQLLINSVSVPNVLCQLNSGSNVVSFSQLNNSQVITNLTLLFNTSTALYSGSFIATISYYAPGNASRVYSSNSAPITIISATMTCSVTSSATQVGATTNYTLSYSPSVFISAGSILQVLYPPWSAYTLTNFPSFTSSAVCAGQCTLRPPNLAQSLNNELVAYANLYSAISSSNMTLTLQQARNPASQLPITISFTLLFYVSSTSQPPYMTCSTTYAPTAPNNFRSITFNSSTFNANIAATNTISLLLSLTNPVSSTTYLQIVYPSDLTLSYAYATSNQLTTQTTFASGIANSLLIGNLTNSTSLFTSLFMASFTLGNAPYASYPLTISFATMNLVSTTYYPVDTGSLSYSFTTGSITAPSISVVNSSINALTAYNLTFTTTNSLISNSLILVTIPIEVTLSNTSTCSCSVASNCIRFNSSSLLVTITTLVVAGGSTLKVTINSVTNPATTTPSSTFGISTYYYNMSTPTDLLNSPVTVTSTSVPLATASVNSSSLVVAATNTYTIRIQIRNALPATSYLLVSFPLTSFVNSASASLSSFTSANVTITSCTMSLVSQMSFNFTSCVPTSLAQSTTITITLLNIINPYSTKPTDSLSISTYYNSLQMQYLSSGVSLTLTTPTTFTYIGATPTSPTVNAITTYNFTVTFQQQHYSGDRVIITFPSALTIVSGFICSTNASSVTVACFQNGQLIVITFASSSPLPSGLIVSVTNIKNNWFTQTLSLQVQTTTNDTTYYYVEQGTASTVLQAAALSITYSPSNSLVLLSPSTLQITITSPFSLSPPIPSLLRVVVTPPNDFILTTPSCTSSLASSVCTNYPTNLTVTSLTSFSNTVTVGFSANATYFTTSSPFNIVLSYNGSNVATNSVFTVNSYCLNPCQGCTSNASQCTSCLPTPYSTFNYLFPINSTCVSVCPATYYLPLNTVVCQACDSLSCLTCTTTATTCTSCGSPKFLMNSSCVLSCPNGYYGSNNVCVPCVNQCLFCSNITYCLSCVVPYSLNPDQTCQFSCLSGYASINYTCRICTTNCLTCSGTVSSCLSCSPAYILYNSTCSLSCPIGQFNNSNSVCQTCVPPCSYCISALVCTSCISNYSLYNGTQCVNPCPAGTFIYTSYCRSCDSPCQTCYNTATNCTSCSSNLYFYLFNCFGTCPVPTYAYQGTCTTCVSPCSSCLSNAFSCASCITGYYLLNITCISSCPSVGYLTQNSSCVACPSNCLSCASPTTCSICQAEYLQFQGGCLTACPTTSPIIINQACTGCAAQCATCGAAPDQCITCTVYYYKYSYTCVQSCPLAYYSNELSYTCESGLSSKIVFFPVLISYVVVIVILIIIKIFSKQTSFPTALAALSGWLQIAISAFLLSLLFQLYLEPGINYAIPKALLFMALLTNMVGNILHFKLNWARLQSDEYIRKWQTINLNHSFLKAIRIISLLTHHRFFRLIYSKLFNSIHFSMIALKPQNIFTYSTVSTIYALLLSELLVIVASFYLAYYKLLKDQVFYTACEALIVTLTSIFVSLIDIYKPKDYFEDTEFMETKRYLQKVNNTSLNKVEDEYRDKDEGSLDGERCVGSSGGKFIFAKHDPTSMNQILFEENSAATDIHGPKAHLISEKGEGVQESDIQDHEEEYPPQVSKSKSNKNNNEKSSPKQISKEKSSKLKINIFEPIQEDEAQYYQILKYDEEDFKTAVKMQKQKIDGNQSEDQNQDQLERKEEFRPASEQIDDRRSMMEYRERREQWNNLIDHRQKLAHQIFNTVDTKELYKQLEKIEEPQNQDEDKDEDLISRNRRDNRMKEEEREEELVEEEREKKKNRRRRKYKGGNKELEQIYLQRLAEKVQDPKRKTMMASSKSFKYQF